MTDFCEWLDYYYNTSEREIAEHNLGRFGDFITAIEPLIREYCECNDCDAEEEQIFIWGACDVYIDTLTAFFEDEGYVPGIDVKE